MSKFPVYHAIARTSKFGEAFRGKCLLCGKEDLQMIDALVLCPNPNEYTYVESILAALEGEPPPPKNITKQEPTT